MHIVSGIYKRRNIAVPKSDAVRPTSERLRETVFDICQGCVEDVDFLDLFAGSGAMGLEALSRGAKSSTFIDNHRESIQCIKKNVEALGVQNATSIFQGDVFDSLARLSKSGRQYGIIYADPPYGSWKVVKGQSISFSRHVLEVIDAGSLLVSGGILFLEESMEAAPHGVELQTLELISSRRLGRSLLLEYTKK